MFSLPHPTTLASAPLLCTSAGEQQGEKILLQKEHTRTHSFIKLDYFTGSHGNLLMQYFAAVQHGYSFVTVHCIALNMTFKSFEAVFCGQNQMANKKMQQKVKFRINVKSP